MTETTKKTSTKAQNDSNNLKNAETDDSKDEAVLAKKTPVKKTAAKKRSPKTNDLASVTEDVLNGKYGTGRERDILLRDAGFDPDVVRKEVYRVRGERIKNNN